MLNYYEPVDFDSTVYTVTPDGEIDSHLLGELVERYAQTTTTSEGVVPRAHIRNVTELWTWDASGKERKLLHRFSINEEAEHALLLTWRWDMFFAATMPPIVFDTEAEANDLVEDILRDEADALLLEAQDKGVCALPGQGVWLCRAEYMLTEQEDWSENDRSKNIDFTTSKFWLSADDGVLEAISGPDDLISYLKQK